MTVLIEIAPVGSRGDWVGSFDPVIVPKPERRPGGADWGLLSREHVVLAPGEDRRALPAGPRHPGAWQGYDQPNSRRKGGRRVGFSWRACHRMR